MDQKQDPAQTPPTAEQPAATAASDPAQAGIPAPSTSSAAETPAATDAPAAPETPAAPAASGSNSAKILSSEPAPKGKSKGTMVVVGIALLVIVIGGAYLFFFRHSAPTNKIAQNTVTPTVAVSPTPGVTPVTAANVDQTLDNVDNTMQQSSSQATTDINTVSSIDSSQDNTTGL